MAAKGTELMEFADGICVKDGVFNDGGGVNVGGRVPVGTILNCAASVGSMVAVGG